MIQWYQDNSGSAGRAQQNRINAVQGIGGIKATGRPR